VYALTPQRASASTGPTSLAGPPWIAVPGSELQPELQPGRYAGRSAAGPIRSKLLPSGKSTRSSMRAPRHMPRTPPSSPRGQAGMPVGGIRRHRGVSAGLTSRRQIKITRVCGSSWRQFSSDTGTSGRSAMRRSSSSDVSFATARMQSRNFSVRGVVVSYAPPVCLRTSATTTPGEKPFVWPLCISGWSGTKTSADVLNVAIFHTPATARREPTGTAARHHGQVQFVTRMPGTGIPAPPPCSE